ncbi:hypothetical protein RND71_028343 [Anisodus tanguticus]|uniref:Uncharacterized protein n=1 Tax=Anisodus tanguticus TaxID=243964 RepID=A0AAE1V9Z4_9SOLA|nr:hypothetical protein RND71_028343 [Anisodus tanguticus]
MCKKELLSLLKSTFNLYRWNLVEKNDRCICEFVRGKGKKGLDLQVQVLHEGATPSITGDPPSSSQQSAAATTDLGIDGSENFSKSVGRGRYDHRKREQPRASEASRAAKMLTPENPNFLQILEKYNIVRNRTLEFLNGSHLLAIITSVASVAPLPETLVSIDYTMERETYEAIQIPKDIAIALFT